ALFISFLGVPALFAAEPLRVEPGQMLFLGKHLDFRIDPTARENLETVQKAEWKANTAESPNFGFSSAAIWLRFKLVNPGDRPLSYYVQVAYPILDTVDFFHPVKNGYEKVHTGDLLRFRDRPFQHRFFIFPITLEPRADNTYYLRAQNEDALQIPVQLIAQE